METGFIGYVEGIKMFFCKKKKTNLKQIKNQVQDNVMASKEQLNPALAEMADKADKIKDDMKDVAEEQVEQLSKKVQSKPIKAVLISTIIGFVLGRMTR